MGNQTVQQQLTAAFIQRIVDEAVKRATKPKKTSRILDVYKDPDSYMYNISLYVDECGDVVINGRVSKK